MFLYLRLLILFESASAFIFSPPFEPLMYGLDCRNNIFPHICRVFSGGQFFRIRNYKDNSEKWCRSHCDFSYESRDIKIQTEQCELGKCLMTTNGLMWCIKRYTDDEIVLQGCGDDEYTYRRTDKRTEQFSIIKIYGFDVQSRWYRLQRYRRKDHSTMDAQMVVKISRKRARVYLFEGSAG